MSQAGDEGSERGLKGLFGEWENDLVLWLVVGVFKCAKNDG